MPAPNQVSPQSRSSAIRLYLLDHPGPHSAADIATGLPTPDGMDRTKWVQKVANDLARLARQGKVTRERSSAEAMGPGVTYSLPKD